MNLQLKKRKMNEIEGNCSGADGNTGEKWTKGETESGAMKQTSGKMWTENGMKAGTENGSRELRTAAEEGQGKTRVMRSENAIKTEAEKRTQRDNERRVKKRHIEI